MKKIYQFIDLAWGWVSEKVFVRFEFALPVEDLKRLVSEGNVTFVLTHGGVVEWLILSSWCRSQGLGAILVVNRKRILLVSKPLYFFQILFKTRRYADLFCSTEEKGPRLLFAPTHERSQLFVPTPVERLLADVHTKLTAENRLSSFVLVPTLILWRKYLRGQSRKLSEFLLGLSSNPNLIGKVWYLLRARMDSSVRSIGILSMDAKDATDFDDAFDESDAYRSAKSTRRKIFVLVNQEMRILLGPRYQAPHSVKETLMRDPDIQKLMLELSKERGVDIKKVMLETYHIFGEIVSNYSYRFVEVMYVLLSWLFTKWFDGLESVDSELQEIREIMKTRPVVFIPCHRSHLDYLVIPYVLFLQDMITPHILAGINLSFWPAGQFARMGGAFFVRRSFRGDPLYTLCLKKYVEYLLKNRFNIKFFIEGTRSRTGKTLPPAYGFLKMVMETYQNKACDDIALVPVSICYDEVLEQGAYTKELAGGQKTKESTRELIKSRKTINKHIGKVYVHFAKAIFLKDVFKEGGEKHIENKFLLQKTAFQICKGINDATPITPKSLVCTTFLCDTEELTLDVALDQCEKLARLSQALGSKITVQGEATLRQSCEQTIKSMSKAGLLVTVDATPKVFYADPKKRLLLNFYKNNSIHVFITPALAVLAVAAVDPNTPAPAMAEAVRSKALILRNLLKFEFFFNPTATFLNDISCSLNELANCSNWQELPGSDLNAQLLKHNGEEFLTILRRIPLELLESYCASANFITNLESPVDKKTWIKDLVKFAEEQLKEAAITSPEAVSTQSYSNAILCFENMKIIESEKDKDTTHLKRGPAFDTAIQTLTEYQAWANICRG